MKPKILAFVADSLCFKAIKIILKLLEKRANRRRLTRLFSASIDFSCFKAFFLKQTDLYLIVFLHTFLRKQYLVSQQINCQDEWSAGAAMRDKAKPNTEEGV